jgi:formate dehydrogenase subunit gamma
MAGNPHWSEADAATIIASRAGEKGAMLPILHDLQARFGYIDDAAVPLIASALNISRAEVVGVISFYHDFRRAPVQGRVLKLCRAESCQAAGCDALATHLQQRHAGLHVETVYCLGHCAVSPAAMLDDEPLALLTPERLDAALAEAGL